ncbi:phage tail protein [Latilactobacillus sakei]|uniref:phage tail protein n=1 Tax=Latilactobacillus sakei TaxID=1599 RepID=UPI0020C7D6C5|nr:phage tail protein [Latilactobacillus sakei]MCP8855927.1 phage tail protein [Latilactobacillus sakei]
MANTVIVQTFDNVSIAALSFLFKDEEAAILADCVGKFSAETEMQEIVKKCGSTEVKKISKPIKMTAKITAHIPLAIYRKFYGLHHNEKVKPGIYSYGPTSKGQQFALAAKVVDEFEDNAKLEAMLNVSSSTGLTFEIENGADEVAALELEASVMVDSLGEFYHEAIVTELEDPKLEDAWMTKLNAETLTATAKKV